MAKVVKFFKALRNNPKKSIFFSAAAIYGGKYARDKYNEEQLLARYCREAALYGEQPHSMTASHRHITVLLNPAAAGGKCKVQFDKYCAPLLHLAGLKVAIVRTEHQGQARDLMALMDKTDGVMVAGGDGTLSEVLTGLLRREDSKEAAARLPLSVLPLSGTNSYTAKTLWGSRITGDTPQHQQLLEATMAVVRQVFSPMDVMEITPHSADEESPSKAIYGNSLEWGAFRDAWERRDVYWYYASLRTYATYLFSSYKDLSWDCSSTVHYTAPCSGCSSCRAVVVESTPVAEAPAKRWYQYLLPKIRLTTAQQHQHQGLLPPQPEIDYSVISNPSCGEVHQMGLVRVCDVRVNNCNTASNARLQPHEILLSAGPSDTSTTEFIKEGWQRNRAGSPSNNSTEIIAGSITITPTASCTNEKGEDREFYLDGESYEVRPVTIRSLPRAVIVFCPPVASTLSA